MAEEGQSSAWDQGGGTQGAPVGTEEAVPSGIPGDKGGGARWAPRGPRRRCPAGSCREGLYFRPQCHLPAAQAVVSLHGGCDPALPTVSGLSAVVGSLRGASSWAELNVVPWGLEFYERGSGAQSPADHCIPGLPFRGTLVLEGLPAPMPAFRFISLILYLHLCFVLTPHPHPLFLEEPGGLQSMGSQSQTRLSG